jgi:hypothetical protein
MYGLLVDQMTSFAIRCIPLGLRLMLTVVASNFDWSTFIQLIIVDDMENTAIKGTYALLNRVVPASPES